MAAQGLDLPIDEPSVRFPYFGNTLAAHTRGQTGGHPGVAIRGRGDDPEVQRFARSIIEEIRIARGIDEAEVLAELDGEIAQRGIGGWEWVHSVVGVLERRFPGLAEVALALRTADVEIYLNDDIARDEIDAGVAAAIAPGVPTVVVGHSLGSVVAYRLLRGEAGARGWVVPEFITLGSPLGMGPIRAAMRRLVGPARVPHCVGTWFNAMDERDIVPLYPLDPRRFPLSPATPEIINRREVRNPSAGHHDIAGYLEDPVVARRIHDALTG